MTHSPKPKYIRGTGGGTPKRSYYWTYDSFIHYMITLILKGERLEWMESMSITEVDELPPGAHAAEISTRAGY